MGFLLGKISPYWHEVIEYCNKERRFDRKPNTKKIILANMEFALSLWKTRCSLTKEKSTKTPQLNLSIQKCIDLANHLHSSPNVIPTRDQHLIPRNPTSYFHHQSHNFLHTWYQYIRLLESEYKKHKHSTSPVYEYFQQ